MTERRYTEDEVAAIFERATEVQQTARRHLPPGEGMTLANLQEIGREVGIPAELVAEAARSLEQRGQQASKKFLGFPIGVGRTIELGRYLTEEEWEQLVVDLRETFDARGTVRYDGSFRQWTNGNLQALLEPTPEGHRLRLRTIKGEARQLMGSGLAFLGGAAVSLGVALVVGLGSKAGGFFLPLFGMGAGLFGFGAFRLPTWARLRQRQMDGIAARLALASKSDSKSFPPSPEQ